MGQSVNRGTNGERKKLVREKPRIRAQVKIDTFLTMGYWEERRRGRASLSNRS